MRLEQARRLSTSIAGVICTVVLLSVVVFSFRDIVWDFRRDWFFYVMFPVGIFLIVPLVLGLVLGPACVILRLLFNIVTGRGK